MRSAIVLALVALLVAVPALAQTEDDVDIIQASHDPATGAAPAPLDTPDRPGARGLYGSLAGIGMVGLGTVVGAIVGSAMSGPCDPHGLCLGGLAVAAGASIGTLAGVALLYPLGVWLGAGSASGRGELGWTYLGALIGDALAAGLVSGGVALYGELGGDSLTALIAAIMLGVGAALVGPIFAYEVSDHDARRSTGPRTRAELAWVPTLSVDANGARAGIVGAF